MTYKLRIACLLALSIFVISCNDEPDQPTKPKATVSLKLVSPEHEQQYTIGDYIVVDIEVIDSTQISDLKLYVNDVLYTDQIESKTQSIKIPTDDSKVGFVSIFLVYNDTNGKARGVTRNVVLFSDVIPTQKIASIVNTYTHKSNSYTQGLEFYKGKLYESTGSGDHSESFIAEVELNTGKHSRTVSLDPVYFGEGLTILNDTIYQLTWQKQKCMVYTLDFKKISEFDYEGEGWGLCNNGKSLIMTNGTSKIVWRNPKTFEIEKEIYAFNDEADVNLLNEVELINGQLFSNVYLTNYIVEIDTTTGKVISKIDCAGIEEDGRVGNANVLNGIAHHSESGKIYLTGKLWPKLYEVKFE